MANQEDLYDSGEDSSLEKFEEELLEEEKKKARSNFLRGILVLALVGGIGFYAYKTFFATTPTPRVRQAARAVRPPAPAPAMKTDAVKPAPAPAPKPAMAEKAVEKPIATQEGIKEEQLKSELKVEVAKPAPVKPLAAKPFAAKPKAEPPAPVTAKTDGKIYTLQVGFFSVSANADRAVKRLQRLNLEPKSIKRSYTAKMVKVYVGDYPYRETAMEAARELATLGFKSEPVLTSPGKYELEVGSFKTEAQADNLVKDLEKNQIEVRLAQGTKKVSATVLRLEGIEGTQRFYEVKELLIKENISFFLVHR